MKKPASLPDSPKSQGKYVKVSVLVPTARHRVFSKLANKQRRSMSAQMMELAEKGYDSVKASGG